MTMLMMSALLLIVGCSEQLAEADAVAEEEAEGEPVTVFLDLNQDRFTRGAKYNIPSISAFTVYGIYNGSMKWNNITLSKDPTTGVWSPNKTMTWPNGALNAFCIIPDESTIGIKNVIMKRQKKEDDKINFPKSFEYELPDSNKYQNDVLFGSVINVDRYTYNGSVKFTPRNFLSYVQFKIRLMIEELAVSVRSATIHQTRTTAKIVYHNTVSSQGTVTVGDDAWGQVTQVFGDQPVELEYGVTTDCSGDSVLLIQPQTTTAWVSTGTTMYQEKSTKVYQTIVDADAAHNSYIELDCQLKKDNGSGGYVYLTEDYSTWDADPHWVKVYFALAKKAWKTNVTNSVAIKFDVPYDANGQPIVLPPYTPTTNTEYSVTVEEWEDDTNDDNSLYIKFVDNN